jgi:histidine triad (HIT) family protein
MKDDNCVFCKIAANEIPSTQIYEDSNFLVIFDAYPHIEGQSLVITKNHISSKFEEIPEEVLVESIKVAKKVSEKLKVSFNAERIVQVIEGLDVAHMHIKLFPVQEPEKFGLQRLERLYPTPKEMISPEEFTRLKRKYEEGLSGKVKGE